MAFILFSPIVTSYKTIVQFQKLTKYIYQGASQVVLVVKKPPAGAGDIRDMGSVLGLGRPPGGREGLPTPLFLLGESHGQKSLVNCSP